MFELERNRNALTVMVIVCGFIGWILGGLFFITYLGLLVLYLFIGLTAIVLPILVFIATDKRAHWLLLGSFILALTASTVATCVWIRHGSSGSTMDPWWIGFPLFFKAWGVAFISGLPGVLIGAGVQWVWEEIQWRYWCNRK